MIKDINMDKYSELIEKISNLRTDQGSLDNLRERIVAAANNQRAVRGLPLYDLLFGWTNIVWLRRGLITASLLLFAIFVIQQYVIINRIDFLETRMVSITPGSITEFQREAMRTNSQILDLAGDNNKSDSINVSVRDLAALIREYRDLQEKYLELNDEIAGSHQGDQLLKGKDEVKFKL